MTVEINGYSERGVLFSLFHEIKYHPQGLRILGDILSEIKFKSDVSFKPIEIEIMMEQSFSDFGDADVVLLIKGKNGSNQVVFIEAKVQASVKTKSFKMPSVKYNKKNVPSLYRQLFLKYLMVKELKRNMSVEEIRTIESNNVPDALKKMVGETRKIGKNPVVHLAVQNICKCLYPIKGKGQVFYVALVPKEYIARETEFWHKLKNVNEKGYKFDSLDKVGIIQWGTLYKICHDEGLDTTKRIFELNGNQICRNIEYSKKMQME